MILAGACIRKTATITAKIAFDYDMNKGSGGRRMRRLVGSADSSCIVEIGPFTFSSLFIVPISSIVQAFKSLKTR